MRFRIYRFNPETDAEPRMQDVVLDIEPAGRMLLDALIAIKTQDESLSLRRSCKEGVCGSDAVNVNGKNCLACITPLSQLKEPIEVRPLPGLPVVRDLVAQPPKRTAPILLRGGRKRIRRRHQGNRLRQ